MSASNDKRLLSPRAGLVPGVGVAAQNSLNNIQPSLLIDGAQCFVIDQRALYEFRAGNASTPPILGGGSTNDNEIGGTARANGGLPYIEPTNNAMMVVDP